MISYDKLLQENAELRENLDNANEILEAIRTGEVDALVVSNAQGNQVFTLKSADQPYRVLVEEMQDGALTLSDDGTILYCNRYFATMLARPSEEILSHSIYEYFPPADLKTLRDFLQQTRDEQKRHDELNIQSSTGDIIPIHLAANTLRFDQLQVTCLVIADLRAQKQREQEINLLQTLGLEISQAHSFDLALRSVLERICLKTEWEVGEVWMQDKEIYYRTAGWHNSKIPNAFDEYNRNIRIPIGQGLVGKVWSSKSPIWFPSIADEPRFQRQEITEKVGIQSGVGIPVMVNEEIVAVIIFLTLQSRPRDQHFTRLISSVVSHLGTYIVHKQAEEQIHYQANLLEIVHDPIISTDVNLMIISWNEAAGVLYGWSAKEVIGKHYIDVLRPKLSFSATETVPQEIQVDKNWSGEVIHTARNGREIYTLGSITTIRDESGKPIGAVATQRDITERKQAESALAVSDQRFSLIINNVRDYAIYALDSKGNVTTWNEGAASIKGYAAEEIIGENFACFFTPEDIATGYPEHLLEMAKREGSFSTEGCQVRKDGTKFSAAVTITAMHDKTGMLLGYSKLTRDLTEPKRAEEALIQSERFARSTVDALSAQIAILDESGRIMAVNQEWRNFAQSNGGDLNAVWEGENYLAICDTANTEVERARAVAKGIRNIIKGNRNKPNQFVYEYASPTRTEQRWFNVRITPFVSGGPIRVVIAYENITDRKLAENALLVAHEHLVVLNRVMFQTSTTLDPHIILELACKELGRFFAVPQIVAALINDDNSALSIVAEYSKIGHKSALGEILSRHSDSVRAFVNQHKTPFVVIATQLDPRFAFFQDFLVDRGIDSLLIIPLLTLDKFIGLIGVYTNEQRVFTESEMILVGSVAQVISQSLENSLLHKSIADQNIVLEQTVEKRTNQLILLNKRISTILDNTSDAIILTQSDGTIENTNLAFDRLFTYERNEMFGRSIAMLSSSAHRENMLDTLTKIAQNGNTAIHLQISAIRKDSSTFDADCGLAYVKESEGFVVWSMRDITHLKAVERMKDQFVSMVSHELRTPLTSMVLSASSLQRYYDRMNDSKRREVIDRLNDQGAVMVNLIESILDLSRIDAQLIAPGEALIDMHLVVKKVILQLQDTLTAKNHILKLNLDESSNIVTGSDIDFTRIWRNLVSNAIKYTPDGGIITLSLGILTITSQYDLSLSNTIAPDSLKPLPDLIPGTYLIGQVADTGNGISPKDQEQLFSRFFRGSASQTNIPGTGLGLALVRDLLKLYGGNISVVSHLSVGSIFSFWLPMDKESKS